MEKSVTSCTNTYGGQFNPIMQPQLTYLRNEAIHLSEVPLARAIQLKQLSIPNSNVINALGLRDRIKLSRTRCAKRRFGITIWSKQQTFNTQTSDVDHADGLDLGSLKCDVDSTLRLN